MAQHWPNIAKWRRRVRHTFTAKRSRATAGIFVAPISLALSRRERENIQMLRFKVAFAKQSCDVEHGSALYWMATVFKQTRFRG